MTLWDLEQATAREVLDALSADGRTWAYTTAKTLLDRLEAKGYVTRDRRDLAHVFRPSVGREEYLRNQTRALRDELYRGQAAPFVHALLDGLDLSQAEIHELRTTLDEMAQSKRKPRR